MKIQNSYSNNSFKGIYAISGSKIQIAAAKQLVSEEAKNFRLPVKTKTIRQSRNNIIIGVATGSESLKRIGTNEFKTSALNNIIIAKEMINPFKTIKFLCSRGQCIKKVEFKFDGKEITSNTWFDSEKNKSPNKVEIIRFNKPKPIIEALKELANMPKHLNYKGKGYIFDNQNILDLLQYEDDIIQCSDLMKFKIKGLCGKGGFSTVFELPNNYCLKIGLAPNAPLKDEIYDIPTILKRKTEIKCPLNNQDKIKYYIYYTVQKKGLNQHEYYIKPKHLKKVEDQIKHSHKYADIGDYDERQIAIYNGKPYLVDAAIVYNRQLYS